MRFTPVALTIALPFVLLSACSNEPDAQTADGASDPASEQALNGDSRAAELVGGTNALRPAPAPRDLGTQATVTKAMQKAAQAAVSPGGGNCAEQVEYSTAWAAKLPGTFPVYPRGNTKEAAGTDEGACALRVVSFRSPVPLDEVLAFYNTRALANGYSAEHVKAAGDNILSGTKGEAAYVVYGRRLPSGVTEIDLVTSNP